MICRSARLSGAHLVDLSFSMTFWRSSDLSGVQHDFLAFIWLNWRSS
ncbi:hypothetical protein HNO89_003884 [Sporosarcina luteola]|nr:hypothetical protein [Sporosarcina luteola]